MVPRNCHSRNADDPHLARITSEGARSLSADMPRNNPWETRGGRDARPMSSLYASGFTLEINPQIPRSLAPPLSYDPSLRRLLASRPLVSPLRTSAASWHFCSLVSAAWG